MIVNNILGKFLLKINFINQKIKSKYFLSKISHGKSAMISGNCTVAGFENIEISDNSYINGDSYIIASKNAKIIIGKNCLISYNVHMRTDMHNYLNENKLIKTQGNTEKNIIIGDDVWIGYGVQIMSGVKINNGVVVAAGAVVTKDIPAYEVWGGVPARKIKERN